MLQNSARNTSELKKTEKKNQFAKNWDADAAFNKSSAASPEIAGAEPNSSALQMRQQQLLSSLSATTQVEEEEAPKPSLERSGPQMPQMQLPDHNGLAALVMRAEDSPGTVVSLTFELAGGHFKLCACNHQAHLIWRLTRFDQPPECLVWQSEENDLSLVAKQILQCVQDSLVRSPAARATR